MDCSLCNLEVIESQKISETEKEFILYNKWAATKGQCLVVPKRHVGNIRDLDESELNSLIKTVKKVSEKLNSELNPDGFNYGFNENQIAGQEFKHLHFHVIPRYNEDNLRNNLIPKPTEVKKLADTDLKLQVDKFKSLFLENK